MNITKYQDINQNLDIQTRNYVAFHVTKSLPFLSQTWLVNNIFSKIGINSKQRLQQILEEFGGSK